MQSSAQVSANPIHWRGLRTDPRESARPRPGTTVRARIAQAHGFAPDRIVLAVIRTTGDAIKIARWRRPAAGPVHQGDRGGAPGWHHRPRGAGPRTCRPCCFGLAITAEREDVRDAYQPQGQGARRRSRRHRRYRSLRRQALVKRCGAISRWCRLAMQTRLRKLDEGVVDATCWPRRSQAARPHKAATAVLPVDEFLPAVGQGIIAIETRVDDAKLSPACGHRPCRDGDGAGGRARLPDRARRFAARRSRATRRLPAVVSGSAA